MDDLEKIKLNSPKLYSNLKEHNFLQNDNLDADFKKEILDLKFYLTKIKEEFDLFDKNELQELSRIKYLEAKKSNIFKQLNLYFINIGKITNAIQKEQYRTHQLFAQKELYTFIGITPFNRQIYEKPLGYPGDFIMMNYLYEDSYAGNSTYEKLIHRYSCSIPISKANINRKMYFKSHIIDTINKMDGNAKIASIACGPAKEFIEVLKEKNDISRSVFTFFDFEPKALEQVKKDIADTAKEKKLNILFVKENILSLLKQKTAVEKISSQDLIYAAGLIDYMNDKLSARFVETMYSLLNDNGRLIIGNVSKGNELWVYTEMLGEWSINYRDENDMLSLAKKLTNTKRIYVEPEKETKMNLFLVIEK